MGRYRYRKRTSFSLLRPRPDWGPTLPLSRVYHPPGWVEINDEVRLSESLLVQEEGDVEEGDVEEGDPEEYADALE